MKKYIASTLAFATAFGAATAETFVTADITTNATWTTAGSPYILARPIFVKDNARLTIQPGVIVRGQPRSGAVQTGVQAGTPGALIVTQTGKISAIGNDSSPIIFTTAAIDQDQDGVADASGSYLATYSPGNTFLDADPANYPLAPLNADGNSNVSLWGGMVICGNAPTNVLGAKTTTDNDPDWGTALVEGLVTPGFPEADATFGGVVPSDNSGSLKFASIRHAGDEIGSSNELNGLTLAGVGYGTAIENVEIYCNFDDGIEWFGGTVFGKNLVVAFAGDDSFDMDQGYTGINQNLFAVMPFFKENDGGNYGSASGDKGCEWDGDDSSQSNAVTIRSNEAGDIFDDTAWPLSGAVVFNMTLMGSAPAEDAIDGDSTVDFTPTTPRGNALGMRMRHGFAGMLVNSLVMNTGTAKGLEIKNDGEGSTANTTVEQNVENGYLAVLTSSFYQTNVDASGVAATTFGTVEEDAMANGNAITVALNNGQYVNYKNASFNGSGAVLNDDTTFDPQGATALTTNAGAGVLDGSLKATKLNPRPIGSLATFRATAGFGPGVANTTYRGAFDPAESDSLWTTGWTALNIGGILQD